MYKNDGLTGGHVIMLGPDCEEAVIDALTSYPNGLQIGGGITIDNAEKYLTIGASHVIVTSYVFRNGIIDIERLDKLVQLVGKDKLVLDLSCRKKKNNDNNNDDSNTNTTTTNTNTISNTTTSNTTTTSNSTYFVVTDKWTKYTNFAITEENLIMLSKYCSEFLVHGVEVEGLRCGIEEDLVIFLGKYSPIPVTYAGGVRGIDDLELVKRLGNNKVDCTVGSALDIFGGELSYSSVIDWHNRSK